MPLPETKEETEREVQRLDEWIDEMHDMINNDGTVPPSMLGIYRKQVTDAVIRRDHLKDTMDRHGWGGYLND